MGAVPQGSMDGSGKTMRRRSSMCVPWGPVKTKNPRECLLKLSWKGNLCAALL